MATKATKKTGAAKKTGSSAVPAKTADEGAVKKARKRIKEEASSLKEQATGRARDYARQGKDRATGTIREFSGAMDDAAKSVDERFGPEYGEYAHMAASAVSSFAEKLDKKDVDELLKDAEALVRKSPVAAIGIAAVAGFAIARLVKAGLAEQDSEQSQA